MTKKLTISLDEDVYNRLHRKIGRGKISEFIEKLVRPHVMQRELASGYRRMAADVERESEAIEWAEALVGETLDDARGIEVQGRRGRDERICPLSVVRRQLHWQIML